MDGNTQDVVPLGLVCGVVLSAQGEGVHDLAAAAIRLERFMGDKRIGIAEGRIWAADAAKCLKVLTPALRHEVIERAGVVRGLRVHEPGARARALRGVDEARGGIHRARGARSDEDEVRTRLRPNVHGDSSGVRGAAWLWDEA